MQKLGLSTKEEFLSETSIGLFSSSKPKFRYVDQEIWLGETLGKSNTSLTPSWKNPKILKMVVLVHTLYLEIEEGLGAKIFTG